MSSLKTPKHSSPWPSPLYLHQPRLVVGSFGQRLVQHRVRHGLTAQQLDDLLLGAVLLRHSA